MLGAIASLPIITDRRLRVTLAAKASLGIDAAWAAGNIVFGAAAESVWLLTFGASYALVFALRLTMLLLERSRRPQAADSMLIASGVIVGMSVVPVAGIVMLAQAGEGGSGGAEIAVIASAAYAFWSLGSNVIGAASLRRDEDALFGLKCAGIAKTLFSMLALEITMVLTFDGAGMDASKRLMLTALTGAFAATGLTVVSGILIRRGIRARRR